MITALFSQSMDMSVLTGRVARLGAIGLLACGLMTSCVNVDEEVSRRPSELWKPPAEALPGKDITVPGPRPTKASDLLGAGPVDLPTLLDVALENNPETRASWYQAKSAAAAYGQSQSPYYPTVTVGASVGREYYKNEVVPGTSNFTTYGPSLQMSWLLFNFGKRSATADSARESLYAANFAYNQIYQDIVLQVITAYYALHTANASLAATEASLENARATYDAANTRLETGLGNKQDMLRSLADVKSVEAQLELDYADIEAARAQLAAAVGIRVGEYLTIVAPDAPPSFEGIDQDVSTMVAIALQQRPDMLQAYAETRAAEYDLEAAQADLWPEFGVEMTSSLTEFDGRAYNPSENFRAALVMEWDIFQGFNKKYAIENSRAQLRQQEADVMAQKLSIVSNVWTFYFAFRSAIKQVDAAREALVAQQQAYDAISIGYETGINSLLDLLTAQQDLDTTRQLLVDSESNLANSIVNLANAVGTLPQPSRSIEEQYARQSLSKEQQERLAVDGYYRDNDPDPEPLEPQWMEDKSDADSEQAEAKPLPNPVSPEPNFHPERPEGGHESASTESDSNAAAEMPNPTKPEPANAVDSQ